MTLEQRLTVLTQRLGQELKQIHSRLENLEGASTEAPSAILNATLTGRTVTAWVTGISGNPSPTTPSLSAFAVGGTDLRGSVAGSGLDGDPWTCPVPDSGSSTAISITANLDNGVAPAWSATDSSLVVPANRFAPVASGSLSDLTLTEGVAMTPVNVAADFNLGTPTATVALQSGTLPAGLSFNGTVLSGTPTTEAGPVTLVFRATNLVGSDDTAFQVRVQAAGAIDYSGGRTAPTALTDSVIQSGHSLSDLIVSGHENGVAILPAMVAGQVGSGAGSDYVTKSTIPGSPMAVRRTSGNVADTENSWNTMGSHDLLVITEGVPMGKEGFWDYWNPDAEIVTWYDRMQALNASTEMMIYATWGDYYVGNPALFRSELENVETPYWEQMQDAVNAHAGGPVVWMIPANRVLMRLYDDMAAGGIVPDLASFEDIWLASDEQAYGPGLRIHMNAIGSYLISLVHYAVIYQRSPVGLPRDVGQNVVLSQELADYFQTMVWDVVQKEPRTGVPAQTSAPTATKLGMNSDWVEDWTWAQPFMDLFRTARRGGSPSRDADGWPTSPAHYWLLIDQNPAQTSLNGRYRITWEGNGTLSTAGLSNVSTGPNWIEGDHSLGGGLRINIDTTDPAPNNVRNITCVKTTNLAAFAAGERWRPEWRAEMEDLAMFRFMDWQYTNTNNQVVNFSDLATMASDTWSSSGPFSGPPLAVMVEMCNEMGINPYWCMPHACTDAFVTSFATYVRDNLNPDLTIAIELSNEIWNFAGQYPQHDYFGDVAEADPALGSRGQYMQAAGRRAMQVMDIWSSVFADQMGRIRRVAGVHPGWPGLENDFLDAPDLPGVNPAPSFDVIATTGYFNGSPSMSFNVATANTILAEDAANGEAAALALMHDYMMANITDPQNWAYHNGVAAARGYELWTYESGSHVMHAPGTTNDARDLELKRLYHQSDYYGEAYAAALTAWEALSESGQWIHFRNYGFAKTPQDAWMYWKPYPGAPDTAVYQVLTAYNAGDPLPTTGAVAAPSISGVPTISGVLVVGQTLTASAASVSGSPTPSRTWQWERGGTPISGANSATYTLRAVDVGQTITVLQTETNSEGSDTAESSATGTIQAASGALAAPSVVFDGVAPSGLGLADGDLAPPTDDDGPANARIVFATSIRLLATPQTFGLRIGTFGPSRLNFMAGGGLQLTIYDIATWGMVASEQNILPDAGWTGGATFGSGDRMNILLIMDHEGGLPGGERATLWINGQKFKGWTGAANGGFFGVTSAFAGLAGASAITCESNGLLVAYRTVEDQTTTPIAPPDPATLYGELFVADGMILGAVPTLPGLTTGKFIQGNAATWNADPLMAGDGVSDA